MGGNQARGSAAISADLITHVCTRRDCLERLLYVVEDWHANLRLPVMHLILNIIFGGVIIVLAY